MQKGRFVNRTELALLSALIGEQYAITQKCEEYASQLTDPTTCHALNSTRQLLRRSAERFTARIREDSHATSAQ